MNAKMTQDRIELYGSHEVMRFVEPVRATQVIARMLWVGLVLLVVALVFVPWQQNSRGKGHVLAMVPAERQQNIEAPIEGRVAKWYVHEGSRVRQGDSIADITDNDPDILSRMEREKLALEDRIKAAKSRADAVDLRISSLGESKTAAVAAAESRVKMARDRVRQAEQSVGAAAAAVKAADLQVTRQRELFEKGLASKRTLEVAELDAARASIELDRAKAALSAGRSDVDAMISDQLRTKNDTSASISDATASKAVAEAEIASANAEIARIEVRLARQSTQSIKAPRDGTISRVIAREGTEMVKAGDVLAVMVPDTDDRAVALWVDGNDVNLMRPGRFARLQFEGWPAIQASGWPTASVGTFGGRVSFVDPADDGHGKFRVLIVPDGAWPDPEMLRQGTRVNGWILLDTVSLGYELWRQVNGFPPEWSDPPSGEGGKNVKPGGGK